MPYFKKYQLQELDGDEKDLLVFDTEVLGEEVNVLLEGKEKLEDRERKNTKKQKLVEKVLEQFDAEKNSSDLAILYEVTGFQGVNQDSRRELFWKNYASSSDVYSSE